jgi:hypothetical protein
MTENVISEARCKCGELRIAITESPVMQLVCHCKDCQAFSGLKFVEGAFFRQDACQISGNTICDTQKGGTGENKINHFCASCRAPMYIQVNVLNGAIAILANRLSPFEFEPKIHLWTSHMAKGVEIPTNIPQSPERPTDDIIQIMLKGFFDL